MNTRKLTIAFSIAVAAIVTTTARAQEAWPSRPVRIIVPYTAGGGTDAAARVIGAKLAERLKQSVVIENRVGASGMIGADLVAKSKPDGYTYVLGTVVPLLTVKLLYKKPSYDPVEDLMPVAFLGRSPLLIAAYNGFPGKSVAQLVHIAKDAKDPLQFASTGYGVTGHLAMELLGMSSGARFANIIYKGGAEAIPDLVGGRVMILVDGVGGLISQVKAGAVRPLAVTSLKRFAVLPDVPTVAETIKDPGYEASTWFGISAAKGTPNEIVNRMSLEINAILKDPEVAEKLLQTAGMQVEGGSADEFAALIQADLVKWQKVIEHAKLEKQ